MKIVPFALVFVLLATASALAQDPSVKPASVAATVNKTWSGIERDFISAADAMPEEKYSSAPTQGEFKGARSFAEQVGHVGSSNFAFFKEFSGMQPDPDEDLCFAIIQRAQKAAVGLNGNIPSGAGISAQASFANRFFTG